MKFFSALLSGLSAIATSIFLLFAPLETHGQPPLDRLTYQPAIETHAVTHPASLQESGETPGAGAQE